MKKVTRGQAITAELWNELPEALAAHLFENCIVSGPGIRLARLGSARLSITADPETLPGRTVEPFEAFGYGKGTGAAALVRVKMGTIDDRDETSGLTVVGDTGNAPEGWWEFSVPPGSTRYGVAQCTINSADLVTAAKFSLVATAPITSAGDTRAGTAPPTAYHKLFKVVVDSNYVATITQYDKGPMQPTVLTSSAGCTRQVKVVRWL